MLACRRCQAAQAERGAGLVEAVVEADVDDVVGGVVAAVGSQVLLVIACERNRRTRSASCRWRRHHAALADAQLLL